MPKEIFITATSQGQREMTQDEVKEYLALREVARLEQEAEEGAKKAKEDAKTSAFAKLASLGLTEAEAKAVIGLE